MKSQNGRYSTETSRSNEVKPNAHYTVIADILTEEFGLGIREVVL